MHLNYVGYPLSIEAPIAVAKTAPSKLFCHSSGTPLSPQPLGDIPEVFSKVFLPAVLFICTTL